MIGFDLKVNHILHLQRRNRWSEAGRLCQELLAVDAVQPHALHLLGINHAFSGSASEAMGLIRKSLALLPGDPHFHGNAARIFARFGRTDDAHRCFGRGAMLGNENPFFWQSLGQALEEAGNRDGAKPVFARAVDLTVAQRPDAPNQQSPAFHYTRHNRALSEAEYRSCVDVLYRTKEMVAERDTLLAARPDTRDFDVPSNNWDWDLAQTYEIDGVVLNPRNSSELLCAGNYRVVNNLRLYAQAYSGYQLATLRPANGMPWIREALPTDVDRLVIEPRTSPPCPSIAEYRVLTSHIVAGLPRLSFPAMFGEIGWRVDGAIVNADLVYYMNHVANLVTSGLYDKLAAVQQTRPLVVVEIGGGFGGLAYLLRQILPNSLYIIVDIPESLAFSATYLSHTVPGVGMALADSAEAMSNLTDWARSVSGPGWGFVPNYRFDELVQSGLQIDLAINTLSLDEMALTQVEIYAKGLATMLRREGYFYEMNEGLAPTFEQYFEDATPTGRFTRRSMVVNGHLYSGLGYWRSRSPAS